MKNNLVIKIKDKACLFCYNLIGDIMSKLTDYPNIGKEIERQLILVEIDSYEKLTEVGSRDAWLKIKKIDPSACINRLMGLEGAIQNISWNNLNDNDKAKLKEFYYENSKED